MMQQSTKAEANTSFQCQLSLVSLSSAAVAVPNVRLWIRA